MADALDASATTSDNITVNESVLRRRNPWNSLVSDGIDLLADVDELDDEEEEDGMSHWIPFFKVFSQFWSI